MVRFLIVTVCLVLCGGACQGSTDAQAAVEASRAYGLQPHYMRILGACKGEPGTLYLLTGRTDHSTAIRTVTFCCEAGECKRLHK